MFTLMENIVEKYNVILNTKKLYHYRINKTHIYMNAFFVMALFMGVFLLLGFLFDFNTSIRFLFYALSISILATYLIIINMIEIKFQKQFKLDYKIRYWVIHDFMFLLGVISGVLSVIYIFIMPEVATMLDKILPAVLMTFVLLFFYLTNLVVTKNYMTYFYHIIYEIMLHSLLFFVLQFVIDISNPILWTLVYAIVLGLIYLFKDVLSISINFCKKEVKSTLQWGCFILALLLFLKLESLPRDIPDLVSNRVIVQEELVFPGVNDIVDIRVREDFYYVIDSTSNLRIYAKDLELQEYYDFTYGISFKTIQDELYLYGMGDTANITKFYKIDGTVVELLGEIIGTPERLRDRHFPIKIDDQYYIVYYEIRSFSFYNYSEVLEVVSLDDDTIALDLSITSNVLYQDNDIYITRQNDDGPYGIFTSSVLIGNTMRRYSDGMMVGYFEVDGFEGLSLAKIEDVYQNSSFVPDFKINTSYYLIGLYLSEDLFVLDHGGASLSVYDYQGNLLGNIDVGLGYWISTYHTFYLNQLYYWGNYNSGKVLVLNLEELDYQVFQTLELSKPDTTEEYQMSSIEDYHYDWNNQFLYIYFEVPLLLTLLVLKKQPKRN